MPKRISAEDLLSMQLGMTVKFTADGVIWRGPCLIQSIVIFASGGASSLTVYDGTSAAETAIMTIGAPDTYSFSPVLGEPIYCDRGVYLDLADANISGTITVTPVDR